MIYKKDIKKKIKLKGQSMVIQKEVNIQTLNDKNYYKYAAIGGLLTMLIIVIALIL